MLTHKLQLYTVENFLSARECDRVVEISSAPVGVLRPSPPATCIRVIARAGPATCRSWATRRSPRLDEKIARAVGIRLPYSEGLQAQRYETGQEFRQHTDYFQPGTSEYATYAGNRGQRTWTFMVYLNDGMTGGGTKFFALDRVFTPHKGMAVAWNNLYPDGTPNPDTLHSGLPVEAGHKIIITKWFRDHGAGPMFY